MISTETEEGQKDGRTIQTIKSQRRVDFYIRDVVIAWNGNLIWSAKLGRKQRSESKRRVTKRKGEGRQRKGRGKVKETKGSSGNTGRMRKSRCNVAELRGKQ